MNHSRRPLQPERPGLVAWALWVYAVIAIGRLGELIPGIAALPLAKLAIGVALAGALVTKGWAAHGPMLQSPLVRTAAWLLLLVFLSVPLSIWRSSSLSFILEVVTVLAVGFVFVFKVGRNWRVVRGTLVAVTAAGAVLALAALTTYESGRIAVGTSYDTNDLAYVLVTVLPLGIAFAMHRHGVKRVAWIGTVAVLLVTALLTQSRGGLLGLLAVALLLVMVPLTPPRAGAQVSKKARWARRALIAGLIGAIVWVQLPDEARLRFATMFNLSADYNMDESNETGRMDIWKRNLAATLSRPVGFGINTFGSVDYMTGGKDKAAHNSLVQIAVELGFLGAWLFLRLYWLAWKRLGTIAAHARERPDMAEPESVAEFRSIAVALRIALVGNFVCGFFLSQAYSNLVWILFAAIAAMIALPQGMACMEQVPARIGKRVARLRRSPAG